ncbi:hypothetical protein PFTANZ_00185, partial [Plasmodium falciparum Tanzania (2000708)]
MATIKKYHIRGRKNILIFLLKIFLFSPLIWILIYSEYFTVVKNYNKIDNVYNIFEIRLKRSLAQVLGNTRLSSRGVRDPRTKEALKEKQFRDHKRKEALKQKTEKNEKARNALKEKKLKEQKKNDAQKAKDLTKKESQDSSSEKSLKEKVNGEALKEKENKETLKKKELENQKEKEEKNKIKDNNDEALKNKGNDKDDKKIVPKKPESVEKDLKEMELKEKEFIKQHLKDYEERKEKRRNWILRSLRRDKLREIEQLEKLNAQLESAINELKERRASRRPMMVKMQRGMKDEVDEWIKKYDDEQAEKNGTKDEEIKDKGDGYEEIVETKFYGMRENALGELDEYEERYEKKRYYLKEDGEGDLKDVEEKLEETGYGFREKFPTTRILVKRKRNKEQKKLKEDKEKKLIAAEEPDDEKKIKLKDSDDKVVVPVNKNKSSFPDKFRAPDKKRTMFYRLSELFPIVPRKDNELAVCGDSMDSKVNGKKLKSTFNPFKRRRNKLKERKMQELHKFKKNYKKYQKLLEREKRENPDGEPLNTPEIHVIRPSDLMDKGENKSAGHPFKYQPTKGLKEYEESHVAKDYQLEHEPPTKLPEYEKGHVSREYQLDHEPPTKLPEYEKGHVSREYQLDNE